jgi:hypothetical protein
VLSPVDEILESLARRGAKSAKSLLQRLSETLTRMRSWTGCQRSLLSTRVPHAGSIAMTNAVNTLLALLALPHTKNLTAHSARESMRPILVEA